jgi:hypothetical protein
VCAIKWMRRAMKKVVIERELLEQIIKNTVFDMNLNGTIKVYGACHGESIEIEAMRFLKEEQNNFNELLEMVSALDIVRAIEAVWNSSVCTAKAPHESLNQTP